MNYTPVVAIIMGSVVVGSLGVILKLRAMRPMLKTKDWFYVMGARVLFFFFSVVAFFLSLTVSDLTIFSVFAVSLLLCLTVLDLIGFITMHRYLLDSLNAAKK